MTFEHDLPVDSQSPYTEMKISSHSLEPGREGMAPLVVSHFAPRSGQVGKIRGLNDDGTLRKVTNSALYNGTVERKEFASLAQFLDFAMSMRPSHALGFGLTAQPCAELVTDAVRRSSPESELSVARTKEYFHFGKEAGILHIDYDPRAEEVPLKSSKIVEILREAIPELRKTTMASKSSSSAFLHGPQGQQLVGQGGTHLFIPVADAFMIPEWGKLIQERLWLHGHGYIKITGAGYMKSCTLVDGAVFSPERICFSRAICEDGVRQDLPPFEYFPGSCDHLFEFEVYLQQLAPLTAAETGKIEELKRDAIAFARPEAGQTKSEWAKRVTEIRCKLAQERGETIDRDAVVAELTSASGSVMPEHLLLYPVDGDPITAGAVYANHAQWADIRFADPWEPEYRNDPRIAMLVSGGREPYIFSHAHGGSRSYFRSEDERSACSSLLGDIPIPRRRFEAVPASEFTQGGAPKWLVKGLIPEGGFAVIYGAPGSGKSFFALDVVGCVAAGRLWSGSNKTISQNVVYICAEGASAFKLRISAYQREFDLELGDRLRVIAEQPNFLDEKDFNELLREIVAVSPGVIVIDTLAQVTPGGDENSAIDMGKALKRCRDLQSATGATVILVHHAGKDSSRGPRGWSGLLAAADAVIEVSRAAVGNVAKVTKMKDGDDSGVYPFHLSSVLLGECEDGNPITSCTVTYGQASVRASQSIVEPRGVNQEAIYKAVWELSDGRKRVTIADAISCAVEKISYDLGPNATMPRRDQRRTNLKRAMETMIENNLLKRNGEFIALASDSFASLAVIEDNEATADPASGASHPLRGEADDAADV